MILLQLFQFGMLIDYEHRRTYVHATTASRLLPALGAPPPAGQSQAAVNIVGFGHITERVYTWPAGTNQSLI